MSVRPRYADDISRTQPGHLNRNDSKLTGHRSQLITHLTLHTNHQPMPSPTTSSSRNVRRDSTGSATARKRRKQKTETSTLKVVLSTLMVYLSYQILTREDDEVHLSDILPNLHLDQKLAGLTGSHSHSSYGAGHAGVGHNYGHSGFPDPYGIGHQIAGLGSQILHPQSNQATRAAGKAAEQAKDTSHVVVRIFKTIFRTIWAGLYFVYSSLNSTLLLLVSLAYYLATPLASIFFSLTHILLSPFVFTWNILGWIWEPIGKWIGGLLMMGVGTGAAVAYIGTSIERFFKGNMEALRGSVRQRFDGTWIGGIFGIEQQSHTGGANGREIMYQNQEDEIYFRGSPPIPPYPANHGYPYSHTAYPYPIPHNETSQLAHYPIQAYPYAVPMHAPYYQPQPGSMSIRRKNGQPFVQARRRGKARFEDEPIVLSDSSSGDEIELVGDDGRVQKGSLYIPPSSSSAQPGRAVPPSSASGSDSTPTSSRVERHQSRTSRKQKSGSEGESGKSKEFHFHFHSPGSQSGDLGNRTDETEGKGDELELIGVLGSEGLRVRKNGAGKEGN
jgi:hypothetical protein